MPIVCDWNLSPAVRTPGSLLYSEQPPSSIQRPRQLGTKHWVSRRFKPSSHDLLSNGDSIPFGNARACTSRNGMSVTDIVWSAKTSRSPYCDLWTLGRWSWSLSLHTEYLLSELSRWALSDSETPESACPGSRSLFRRCLSHIKHAYSCQCRLIRHDSMPY